MQVYQRTAAEPRSPFRRYYPLHRAAKKVVYSKITPEEVERLNQAFTFTLRTLSLVDRDDPLCEIVARKVIDLDAMGIRDPKQIAKIAAKEFGVPK